MRQTPLYYVSIFSQTRQAWIKTTETSMAACVRLVEGLATDWVISNAWDSIAHHTYNFVYGGTSQFFTTRQYSEARRKIIRLNDNWACYLGTAPPFSGYTLENMPADYAA
jgi:hypothetical protein